MVISYKVAFGFEDIVTPAFVAACVVSSESLST